MEMWGLVPFSFIVILVLTVCDITHGSKFASCFDDKKSFKYTALTQYFTHLKTPEECQAACRHDCEGFTWISDLTPVIPNICALFDTEDATQTIPYEADECEDCLSGPPQCPCSFQGECDMTVSNVVDVQLEVKDAACCQDLCNIYNNLGCKYFTFYNETHDFPKTCFLFSTCDKVNTGCDNCEYGEKGCAVCSWEDTQSGVCGPGVADHLLVLGGYGVGNARLSSVEYISLSGKDSCTNPVPPLPAANVGFSTTITKKSLLLSCGGELDTTGLTDACHKWTPANPTVWTSGPTLPDATFQSTMVIVGDKILYIGGNNGDGANGKIWSTDTELTDTSAWTEEAEDLDKPRWGHCSVSHDNFVITTGGRGGNPAGNLVSVELYDMSASTPTVTVLPSLNVARTVHGCNIITKDNGDLELIVTGGYGVSDTPLSSIEVATLSAGSATWGDFVLIDNALPEDEAYFKHTTTKVGEYLYQPGGSTGTATDSENYGVSIFVSSNGGRDWTNITTTSLTQGRNDHNAVATTDLCT
jgi:hypothetical protein